MTLNGGMIVGGTLDLSSGGLTITSSQSNRLNGVSVVGNLELSQSSSTLRVSNGLSVTGEVRLTGSGARLYYDGAQTWDNATVVSSGTGSQRSIAEYSGGTLTLGPGFTLTGSNWFVSGTAVVNQGTLRAESGPSCSVVPTTFTNGGLVEAVSGATLSTSSTNWSSGNGGIVSAAGGTLNLDGTFSTSSASTVVSNGGAVNLNGTVNNTGGTLALRGSAGTWNLNGGMIVGGTLDLSSGGLTITSSFVSNRLNGVSVVGNLELSQSSSTLRVSNGLSVTGEVRLTGSGARLYYDGADVGKVNATVVSWGTGSQRSIAEYSRDAADLGSGLHADGLELVRERARRW